MELGAKYILSVYRNKGFSAAARELGIAQPSLSATVAKFEKELGFKVFNRGTSPLSLTDEGRIYIDHLNEVVESEQNMRYRIAHSSPSFTSALRIGVSTTSYACQQIVILATSIFNKRHPHAPIQLHMGLHLKSEELYKKLRRKGFDFIVTECYRADSGMNAIHLADDYMIFAVRKDLPAVTPLLEYALCRKDALVIDGTRYMADTTVLSELPFISAGGEGTTVKKLSETIGDKYTLSKISLSNHYQVHYQLMLKGMGAAITSCKQLLNPYFTDENIVYFVPKTEEPYQKCYLMRLLDKTPHKHEEEFIELLRDVSKNPEKYI